MKKIIRNYLDGIRYQDPNYKIPTMIVLALLLSITFIEGPHTTVRYFTGTGSIAILFLMGFMVKI